MQSVELWTTGYTSVYIKVLCGLHSQTVGIAISVAVALHAAADAATVFQPLTDPTVLVGVGSVVVHSSGVQYYLRH